MPEPLLPLLPKAFACNGARYGSRDTCPCAHQALWARERFHCALEVDNATPAIS